MPPTAEGPGGFWQTRGLASPFGRAPGSEDTELGVLMELEVGPTFARAAREAAGPANAADNRKGQLPL